MRPLERAAKRRPLHELVGDVFRDELGLDLRPRHLLDLEIHAAAEKLLQLLLQPIDLLPLAADDHAGTRRVEDHLHFVAGPLDLHLRDRRRRDTSS